MNGSRNPALSRAANSVRSLGRGGTRSLFPFVTALRAAPEWEGDYPKASVQKFEICLELSEHVWGHFLAPNRNPGSTLSFLLLLLLLGSWSEFSHLDALKITAGYFGELTLLFVF
uniref:Uncharacterized protein n=1 Tax=Sphaerodactylus townsendi TaxID=933632 RepID=A0ACB8FUE6_9SAUR